MGAIDSSFDDVRDLEKPGHHPPSPLQHTETEKTNDDIQIIDMIDDKNDSSTLENGTADSNSNSNSNSNTHTKTHTDTHTDTTFPEGGFHGWCAIVGGFLVQFCCFGYINTTGVYQDFYIREYLTGVTPSTIGWIGGVQIFLTFSLGAITGRVFDRGYCKQLLIGSTVIYAISLFTLSLAHKDSYYQIFLAHGVGLGMATGMTYTLSFALVGHYFAKRRSLVIGVVSSGSAIGAILHPILVNKLINGPIGFANGVRISASINVMLLFVASFIMQARLQAKEKQRFPVVEWVREPVYAFVIVGGLFCFAGLFFPVFYLQLDAIRHNVPKDIAFYAISIVNASSFFGRTLPGFFTPRVGVFNIASLFTIATGVLILCMMFVKDVTGTVLFAVFYGVCSGATVALGPSLLASTAKDMNEVGTRMGVYFGLGGILGLFATPISGAFLTREYHWNHAIVFSGTMMTVGGVFFGVAKVFFARSRGSHWV